MTFLMTQPRGLLLEQMEAPDAPSTSGRFRAVDLFLFLTVVSLNTFTLMTDIKGLSLVTQVMTVLLVLVWLLVEVIGKGAGIILPVELLLLGVLYMWSFTAMPNLMYTELFWIQMMASAKTLAGAVILVNVIRSRASLVTFFAAFGVAIVVIAALSVVTGQFEELDKEQLIDESRVHLETDFGTHGVTATQCQITIIGMAAAMFLTRRKLVRMLALVPAGVALWLLANIGSRSGFVGLLLIPVLFYWVHLRRSARGRFIAKIGAITLGGLLIVGAVVAISLSRGAERLTAMSEGDVMDEARGRNVAIAREMFLKYPMSGVGVQQFMVQSPAFGGQFMASHNTWIDALTFNGFPGACLYVAAWFLLWRRILRARNYGLSDKDMLLMSFVLIMYWLLMFRQTVVSMWLDKFLLFPMAAVIGYTRAVETAYRPRWQ